MALTPEESQKLNDTLEACTQTAQTTEEILQAIEDGQGQGADIATAVAEHNNASDAHGGKLSVATTTTNGIMSATDKAKLDGIESGANNYVHPSASGDKHIPSGGSSGQILRWSADGTATWDNEASAYTHPAYTARTGKPTANQAPAFGGTVTVSQITNDATGHVTAATDRIITIPDDVATTTAAGLMSSADKTKLDGIDTGANNYTHPTTAGNKHIPSGGSSGKILRWSSAGTAMWDDEAGADLYATTMSLNKTSITNLLVNKTDTVTVTTKSDGAITATTSNSAVATVSVSGKTITVTGKGSGSCTITVNVAKSSTYFAMKDTFTVSCIIASGDLESNDWDVIANAGNLGVGDNYWDVGDTKTVTLNGTVGTLALSNLALKVFIIGFNYKGTNGIYFQGFKDSSGKDVALCDSSYNSYKSDGTKIFNMNHWGSSSSPYNTNYGGWKGCDFRYDILGTTKTAPSGYGATPTTSRQGYDATSTAISSPLANTLMAALPAALRNVLALWTVYTDNTGNSSNSSGNVTTCKDYLTLLSEFEVQGARSYANQYEQNQQAQMPYYANGNSKIKYKHNANTAACYWWLRSPYYGSAYHFCFVSTGGGAGSNFSRSSYGVAPAFRVA